ncbi:MAG: hypothetical protein M3Z13_05235 [Candidatus Dormibacteraeota bacterium]|nr:hypothetical protein [Candidatus Dormibacteraeota bacterium]
MQASGDGVVVDRADLTPTALRRVGGSCAIGAAALTVINGFVLAPGGPTDLGAPAAQIVKGVAGLQSLNELGAFIDALGAGLLLVFVVALGRLAAPRGSLFSNAAALMATVFFSIDVLWSAAEFAFNFGTQQNTDPNASKASLCCRSQFWSRSAYRLLSNTLPSAFWLSALACSPM